MDPSPTYSHHRKIDLQAPADLTYLLTNIRQVAREKLDLAMPPFAAPEGKEDAFRMRVEELVHEYINQTLALALPSLSINGLDATRSLLPSTTSKTSSTGAVANGDLLAKIEPQEEDTESAYEPYDPRLALRLRDLHARFEEESTKNAELRREAPVAAARAWKEKLEVEMREQGARDEAASQGLEKGEELSGKIPLGGGLERREDVEKMWARGIGGLKDLQEGLPGVLARLERARSAIEVVDGR